MGGKVVDIIKEGDLNPPEDRPVTPPPQTAAPDVPEVDKPDPVPEVGNPGGGLLGPITPQVVVYGPDGTAYSNPAAAEAAGVFDYTMSPPDLPSPEVVNELAGPATIRFPDFITNSIVFPEQGYQTVGAGSDPANIQPIPQPQGFMQQPFVRPEAGIPSLLQQSNLFQRPSEEQASPFRNVNGTPMTPQEAQALALQAARRRGLGSF